MMGLGGIGSLYLFCIIGKDKGDEKWWRSLKIEE